MDLVVGIVIFMIVAYFLGVYTIPVAIAVAVLYFCGKSKTRKNEENAVMKNIPDEAIQDSVYSRFDNNPFAKEILGSITMDDLYTGVTVLKTEVNVNYRVKFIFAEHGMEDLNLSDTRDFAWWLANCSTPSGTQVHIKKHYQMTPYSPGETYYYESPGGHLESSRTGGSIPDDVHDGFTVYLEKPEPVKQEW